MPSQLKSFIGSIRRKPTSAADGRSAEASTGETLTKRTSIMHDVANLGVKNTKTLASALPTLASGAALDDKDLLLENGVSMLQSMPLNSGLSEKISDGFITMLWEDMPHPPVTLAGPAARYRRHDGGNNNPWLPEMGKAGTPYSRTVPPNKPKGPNLPSFEAIFESLLKRDGPFRPHPSGLNRLFFSFATVVIHECFQTNRKDQWINDTSSYVDLSTLYGNTEKEQPRVRTYENGLIYPDSIASERIMMMPPGVVAVLLLFSRNHNHIAEGLLSVNEEEKYKPWASLSPEQQKWQDEDIFQITRNINVGFFATVVLKDYVASILNTPRADSEWSLNLGKEIKRMGKRVERGTGNAVSVEFAVLYHWHASLSDADAVWMEDILRSVHPNLESLDDVTPELFHDVMKVHGAKMFTTPARTWTFGGLERGPDGRFDDAELAKIIKDCVEEPAHAFGARGTPASLRAVDLMGMKQAREIFNVCTLNEFRRYLNLKEYEDFSEWNDDPEVARAAELLYGHIDNLELYVGLQAECTKPAMPGSGVCPTQTTGRGILDDAVALIRGDRFLSHDLNSTTLTHWGASLLAEAPQGSYGGVMSRLLYGALPGAFAGTSPFALIPFYTPPAVKGILESNKVSGKYTLVRQPSDMQVTAVFSHAAAKQVLNDTVNFRRPHHVISLDDPKIREPYLSVEQETALNARKAIIAKLFFEPGFETGVATFFSKAVNKLIVKNSLPVAKNKRSIDIVRDVTNIAPVLWLAERLAIPLKTVEQPKGLVSIHQVFQSWLVVFLYQNFNIDPANEWKYRDGASRAGAVLKAVFEAHLKTQAGGVKEKLVDWVEKGSAFEVLPRADKFYKDLKATKLSNNDLSSEVLSLGATLGGSLTNQAALLIDLYLSEGFEADKARLIELAALENEAASEQELQGYVFEGLRIVNVFPGIPRVAVNPIVVQDGTRSVEVKQGRTVLVSTPHAYLDGSVFANPEKLNPLRPVEEYTFLGQGLEYPLSPALVGASLAATLRQVFRLKNLRRAPRRAGRLTYSEYNFAGVKLRKYLDSSSKEQPYPTTLTLEYDL